jgi:hypothetical protein
VPDYWKQYLITLILEHNPPADFGDLRLKSVTPILAQTFEKLFVENYSHPSLPSNLLKNQYDFKSAGSTA